MSKDEELIEQIVGQVLAARRMRPNIDDDNCLGCDGCGHCISRRPGAVAMMAQAGAGRIAVAIGIGQNFNSNLAHIIDHTLLKPNANAREIEQLCAEAQGFGFFSVCINPTHVDRCKMLLSGSRVKICAVVGFPLGANSTATKVFEAKDAVSMGADEIDMVINIGALKDDELGFVRDDIGSVVNATPKDILTKVILENAYLSIEEKIKGCLISKAVGADFVKTSTGFGPSGATMEEVALMRYVVGENLGVKAAGGIRDTAMALRMMEAGATRIGASASVKIVTGTA